MSHETVQIDHWTHTRNIDATKKCYHIFTLPYAICEFLKTKCPSQTVKTLPIYGVIHHPASPLALDSLDTARRVMLLKGLPKGLMCPGVTQQLASQTQFSARKLEPSRQRGETCLWKVYDTNHPTSNMETRHWKLHMAKFHSCHLYRANAPAILINALNFFASCRCTANSQGPPALGRAAMTPCWEPPMPYAPAHRWSEMSRESQWFSSLLKSKCCNPIVCRERCFFLCFDDCVWFHALTLISMKKKHWCPGPNLEIHKYVAYTNTHV